MTEMPRRAVVLSRRIRSGHVVVAALAAALLLANSVLAGELTLGLYPGAAPGSEAWRASEVVDKSPSGEFVYRNVSHPELTVYRPDSVAPNGTALIYLPGGGLRALYVGKEAQELRESVLARGMLFAVLRYRTLQIPATVDKANASFPMPPPRLNIVNGNANPAPNDAELKNVLNLAIADCQAALHIVRSHAADWKIDPRKVGLLGASAGGGVALGATIANRVPDVPNFVSTLYGPSLQDVIVSSEAPPLFIATETDHDPVTEGLTALFGIWHEAHRSVEMHAFAVPSLSKRPSVWLPRYEAWLEEQGFLPASPSR